MQNLPKNLPTDNIKTYQNIHVASPNRTEKSHISAWREGHRGCEAREVRAPSTQFVAHPGGPLTCDLQKVDATKKVKV